MLTEMVVLKSWGFVHGSSYVGTLHVYKMAWLDRAATTHNLICDARIIETRMSIPSMPAMLFRLRRALASDESIG